MDNLQAGKPLVADKLTLVPIERFFIHAERGSTGYWLAAHKEPHAIIICDANGIRAVNLEAKEVSLVRLAQAVPDLDTILASLTH